MFATHKAHEILGNEIEVVLADAEEALPWAMVRKLALHLLEVLDGLATSMCTEALKNSWVTRHADGVGVRASSGCSAHRTSLGLAALCAMQPYLWNFSMESTLA
mmetsp:Transcript_45655/g.108712  ORF Transcript_45655/g.108712 Transcript_45655/m.108712 type:complete len:104 (+) Transcript_45655:2617-2928(+)